MVAENNDGLSHAISRRIVMPETVLIVTLCTWDMLYTLYCVRTGLAREQNPVLQASIDHSDARFLIVKGLTFMIPVIFLEILRTLRPKFVTNAMRLGFLAYAVIYIVGSLVASKAF